MHHRFGNGLFASCTDVPLQIADPQHQLGHGGGAFVKLDPQQLPGRNDFAFKSELVLAFAQVVELVDDFAVKPL